MNKTPDSIGRVRYTGLRRTLSLSVLLAVNVLPLAGVVLLGWDVAALMVLYWSENLILGFYTLLKMLFVSPLGALGMGSFFAIHYGGFCAVHGLFIAMLLVDENIEPMPGEPWPIFFVFFQLLLNVIRQVLVHAPPEWMFAFLALFVSHGVSFIVNFVWAGERKEATLKLLMRAPYGRIVVLHIAVLFGGFAIAALGQPVLMLAALVLLKMGIDVALHVREHTRLAAF